MDKQSTTKISSNGIAISFLSSLLGIMIAAILYHFKWNFTISSEQTISLWLIALVFILAIRLYFRVIFIDNFYEKIDPKYLRISLFLIIPLSALAGIIWSFFDFSELTGTIFMIAYCFLLSIFSICLTLGLNKDKSQRIDSITSVVVDVSTTLFWSYYIYFILSNPIEREITDGLQLVLIVFCLLIGFEFSKLYINPFIKYFKFCLGILKEKA
jgi:hypothetical protein